ncbi:hypothetical protein DYB25_006952 [Aphanomyces astaci]|uniref:Uncharacterized protein n=1 Tax=Aphanomyces astaci TaxID=112090 RepID=A0A397FAW9_APHAT|nr:hypothetical protein DYB25_006952 [Aphanomyces astaci]RHZ16768.1 hypothetical protein DYB31_016293 [Aphanomyces astaci]RHZ42298.1 hypothetical protein DYB26_013941 [Aphanomyces astaci]
MKTAGLLSILAMAAAAANQDKIKIAVIQYLQQSPTVTVFVVVDALHNANILNDFAKCVPSDLETILDCKDLNNEEVNSIAAFPAVKAIFHVPDSSAPDPPNISPKPVITPKPIVSDDDAVDNQHKIGPGVLQSLKQSTTVTVSVTFHDGSKLNSVVDTFHKCIKHAPLAGVHFCNDLTLDEVNSFAALPEV